jgi:hypothetical protein
MRQELEEKDGCLSLAHASSSVLVSEKELAQQLDAVSINDTSTKILVCDAGYGFPRETKPRKEKINAIASQLSNFLKWQTSRQKQQENEIGGPSLVAAVQVVGCPDAIIKSSLEGRLIENMNVSILPSHVQITCETLERYLQSRNLLNGESEPVYLSPDAEESLNPSHLPPNIVVIGLLIDRRVQPNRSKNRASKLNMVARRWPLEDCFVDIHAKEPLNVDCVLEGMQQWWWNCLASTEGDKNFFVQAASQAIEHHAKRHPSRPLHMSNS